jgi:BMFP domain-containing protein YqiC
MTWFRTAEEAAAHDRAERDALRARVQALETALIIIRDIPWRSHVRDPEGPARIAREVLKAGG